MTELAPGATSEGVSGTGPGTRPRPASRTVPGADARRRLLPRLDRPWVFALGAVLSGVVWYATTMVPLVPIRPYCAPFLNDDQFPRTDLGEGRLPGDRLSDAAIRALAQRIFATRGGPVRIVDVEGGRALLISWQTAIRFERDRGPRKSRPWIDGQAALDLIPPSRRTAGLDPRHFGVWRWPDDPAFQQSNCQVMASLMLRGERFPGVWKIPDDLRREADKP